MFQAPQVLPSLSFCLCPPPAIGHSAPGTRLSSLHLAGCSAREGESGWREDERKGAEERRS